MREDTGRWGGVEHAACQAVSEHTHVHTQGMLPSLYFAYQVSSKAARVGFDWSNIEDIREKLLEEFEELRSALEEGDEEKAKDEMGDLLFSAVNMARHLQIDPETALNRANRKFSTRFKAMEEFFSGQGKNLQEVDAQEMEAFWQNHKEAESGKVNRRLMDLPEG